MNIISLNVDRRLTNLIKLNQLVHSTDAKIIFLQDVGKHNNERTDRISNLAFNNFQILKGGLNNSLWILTHKGLRVIQQHEIFRSLNTNAIGTLVQVSQHKLYLVNLYIKPRAEHTQLKTCLERISERLTYKRLIIAGDFNATAPSWDVDNVLSGNDGDHLYQNIKLNRGREIETWTARRQLICLNNNSEPTFVSHSNKTSTIDLVLSDEYLARRVTQVNAISLQRIGHRAVTISIDYTLDMVIQSTCYKKDRICEDHFIELKLLHSSLSNNWLKSTREKVVPRLEQLANKFYDTILGIQNKIKTHRRKTNNRLRFNNHTKKLIIRLRKLEDKKGLNTKFRKRKLRERIIHSITSQAITHENIWDKYKRYLHFTNQSNPMPKENYSEVDEDICDKIAVEKFPLITRIVQMNPMETDGLLNLQITDTEIQDALHKLRKKRYTGPEGIKFEIFLTCANFTNEVIKTICKMSFRTAHIPTVCRITTGCIIPKKQAGKYRIVHVGTPLSSLLEQIALARLEHRLEEESLINKRQFGFTASRSRHDLIARVIECAIANRVNSGKDATTCLISLDIDGAFDNVDQRLLIEKIHKDLIKNKDDLRHWLTNFILNRNIQLRINQKQSMRREVCKGVPQGSPLGPILWNYMINDIDKGILEPGKTEILFYADDIIILHNGKEAKELQLALDTLYWRLDKLNLKVNAQKSRIMNVYVGKKANHKQPTFDIHINHEYIPKTKSLNILGVTINDRLKLNIQAETTIRHLAHSITKLSQLRQLHIVRASKDWKSLIHSLIISITIDNNYPILAIDKASSNWMDNLITRSLKTIFGWSNKTSNKTTRLISDIPHTKIITRRQLINRLGSEHKERYIGLIDALDNDQSWKSYFKDTAEISEIYDTQMPRPFHKRFCDPSKLMKTDTVASDLFTRPTWIIAEETNKHSTANLMINEVTSIRAIRVGHNHLQLSYFNTFELIRSLLFLKHNQEKRLALQHKSSILAALCNSKNNDPRIIYLREKIHDNRWSILQMDYNKTKYNLKKDRTNAELRINTEGNLSVGYVQTPFEDYEIKIKENKITRQLTKLYNESCQTTITRTLCEDETIWQGLNPGWVNSIKTLMLTGLVHDRDNTLRFGRRHDRRMKPIGCISSLCKPGTSLTSGIIKHDLTQLDNTSEAVLHRAFNCPMYGHMQIEILDVINKANNKQTTNNYISQKDIENTLKHRRFGQTLLRLLAETAFSSPC